MARRRSNDTNIWPGFVDALSTLLLVVMFVLSIFVVAQFYLGQKVASQETELTSLSAQLAALAKELGMAKKREDALQAKINILQATIDSNAEELASAQAALAASEAALLVAGTAVAASAEELEVEKALNEEQKAEIATMNAQLAALRKQLKSLQEALDASEAKDQEQEAQIKNLSSRLNAALARKVNELQQVRSRFFEALRESLGDRDDVRVVGDRFVFESDILFGSCSDVISPDGKAELDKFADVLLDIKDDIPATISWVLQVDGHADQTPLGPVCQTKFRTNWHLSSARAISVVQYLNEQGVPAKNLLAAGWGAEQPMVAGRDSASLAKNRRIEFKLTDR